MKYSHLYSSKVREEMRCTGTSPASSLFIHEAKFTNCTCPSLVPLRSALSMCAVSPRCPSSHWELEFVRGGVTHSVTHVTAWCQVDRACDVSARCQVGNHLNNASCPALALAGAPLWSVPETSVAWVFNHLACTSLLPINPSPLPHSPHPALPLFPVKKLMRSLLGFLFELVR